MQPILSRKFLIFNSNSKFYHFFGRRELTRLQEEQVVYVKRIEKEKQRKEQLEEGLEVRSIPISFSCVSNNFVVILLGGEVKTSSDSR